MPKINREALGVARLWFPDLQEQDSILEFVGIASCPSDMAISRAEHEIALLREYRTRLIADVVSGKLDVREAAAKLPADEEEEQEGEPDQAVEDEYEEEVSQIAEVSEDDEGET